MTSPIRGSRGTRRWLAFGAVILAETAVGLDLTVLSVALPTLSGALRASESDLQWFSLLPVLGGMMAGLASAEAIARKVGAKLAIAVGFTVLGAGLGLGAATTAASGEAFAATWMAIAGVGAGLTMATATTAALAELSADRAGVGSGVQQALRNVGAPLGSAVLGSALTSAYVSHLGAAERVRRRRGRPGPEVGPAAGLGARGVRARHGRALLVSLGFAAAGVVLALTFMPARVGALVAQPEASPSCPNRSSSSAGTAAADVAPPKT
jgi:MFS transporter, DHA2 family, multidrug resistance protein